MRGQYSDCIPARRSEMHYRGEQFHLFHHAQSGYGAQTSSFVMSTGGCFVNIKLPDLKAGSTHLLLTKLKYVKLYTNPEVLRLINKQKYFDTCLTRTLSSTSIATTDTTLIGDPIFTEPCTNRTKS